MDNDVQPSFVVQQRASDAALMLCQDFPERLTTDQRIKMEVVGLIAPDRLNWHWCAEAIATFASLVERRV